MPSRLTSFLSVLMSPSLLPASVASSARPGPRHRGSIELSALSDRSAWPFPDLLVFETVAGTRRLARARRVGELPWPWRDAISGIHLDASTPDPDFPHGPASVRVRASLHEHAMSFGGVPVVELELIDDGDARAWHYVLAGSYLRARACLRTLIESRGGLGARMEDDPSSHGGLYLETAADSYWLHADTEDSGRTRFVRVQLD